MVRLPMFRFTIRDVLWLTVVVAFAVAWWVDRGKAASESRELTVQVVNLTNEMKAERDQLRKEVAGLHAELAEEAHQHWRRTREFLLADRAAWQDERKTLLDRIRYLETTTKIAPSVHSEPNP
jgi:hypothetical protein